MHKPIKPPDPALDEIMAAWPDTIAVFLRYRMRCVGCPVAGFHTIRDACAEHRADERAFRAAIRRAIARAS